MAYRFKIAERPSQGVGRIARGQLRRARQELARADHPQSTVHETRKCLKRVRSLLRIVRPGISKKLYERETRRLRDCARALSSVRDHDVVRATVQSLLAGDLAQALTAEQRLRVQRTLDALAPAQPVTTLRAPLIAQLDAVEQSLATIVVRPDKPKTIARGMARTYRRCLQTQRAADRAGDDHAFHEWRKHVQHHRRHMQLLVKVWPELFAVRAAQARTLSEVLGRDHDLHLVMMFARQQRDEVGKEASMALQASCRIGQKALRRHARAHASRLFQFNDEAWRNAIPHFWRSARVLKAAKAPEEGPDGSAALAPPGTGSAR